MDKFATRAALSLGVMVAVVGAAAPPAAAAWVRCGDPDNVKVHLAGSGVLICFKGIGRNEFNKVGVDYVEAGVYGGTVIVRGEPFDFKPGQTIRFRPAVNPNFIDLKTIKLPS